MEKVKVKDKKYRRYEDGDSRGSVGPVSVGGMLPGYVDDASKKKKKKRRGSGGFSVFPVNR